MMHRTPSHAITQAMLAEHQHRISLCFLFAGVCIITISSLQALGLGMPSLIISLIRQIVVILPLSFVFAKTMGLVAIFAAYPIAELVALVISIVLFVRTYKKLLKPLDLPPVPDEQKAEG